MNLETTFGSKSKHIGFTNELATNIPVQQNLFF